MSLKKFNELKREVKLANPNLDNYSVNYITSFILKQEKLEVSNKKNEVCKELVNSFWNAHKKAKKESAIAWAGKTERSNIARRIVEDFTEEAINNAFKQFSDFVKKQANTFVKVDQKTNQTIGVYTA